jgi:Zn-dependent membrane protease YugP
MGYFIIIGLFGLVGMLVSRRLKSKFKQYEQLPTSSGLSGAEFAKVMLDHYGIHDVKIVQGKGFLSDHYNPQTKTVSLSPAVYAGKNVSAAAVATHECGHAVQHDEGYAWLQFRSGMVPIVKFASMAQQYLLYAIIGMFGAGISNNPTLILVAIVAFGATALFAVITLPVEFDASNRAIAWLDNSGMIQDEEYYGAKDALWWAAMTYVVGALSAIATVLYLALRFMGSND